MKFIIVTGGVMSGIGKGVVSSSLALLLRCKGLQINMGKIDPYLNIDAGTLNPYEHGECFVLEDGTETDLDLGCYERFLERNLTKASAITSGQIYNSVIKRERNGQETLGQTIQIVPHVTQEIVNRISQLSQIDCHTTADYVVIELGGSVGDIESDIFYNAFPLLYKKYGRQNVYHVHVVPILKTHGSEMKTKPAQHSIAELNRRGIYADIICLRLPEGINNISDSLREKILRNSHNSKLLLNPNCNSVYKVPDIFNQQNVLSFFGETPTINSFNNVVLNNYTRIGNFVRTNKKRILVVGKYLHTDIDGSVHDKSDAYLSVRHAIDHATSNIYSELYEICYWNLNNKEQMSDLSKLNEYSGVILTGGFGTAGYEEMIEIAKHTRTHDIPTLGICLGFQMMVIEYYRNVLGYKNATSRELSLDGTGYLIIDIHADSDSSKYSNVEMGGTLRRGNYNIKYTNRFKNMNERFRHRYHINNTLVVNERDDNPLVFNGNASDIDAPTAFYLENNKCHIATQSHCEYISKIHSPSPYFLEFVKYLV